jgi:predicted ATPase
VGAARHHESRAAVKRSAPRPEARELLGSVYGRFTKGFDTADLWEAKSLLEE